MLICAREISNIIIIIINIIIIIIINNKTLSHTYLSKSICKIVLIIPNDWINTIL